MVKLAGDPFDIETITGHFADPPIVHYGLRGPSHRYRVATYWRRSSARMISPFSSRSPVGRKPIRR